MVVTNHNWKLEFSILKHSCEGIINKVLDTNNQLIFNGQDSRVIVYNGTAAEEIIHIKDIRLILLESKEDIKKC